MADNEKNTPTISEMMQGSTTVRRMELALLTRQQVSDINRALGIVFTAKYLLLIKMKWEPQTFVRGSKLLHTHTHTRSNYQFHDLSKLTWGNEFH